MLLPQFFVFLRVFLQFNASFSPILTQFLILRADPIPYTTALYARHYTSRTLLSYIFIPYLRYRTLYIYRILRTSASFLYIITHRVHYKPYLHFSHMLPSYAYVFTPHVD